MAGAVNVRALFFLFIVIVVLQSAYAPMPEYTPAITRTLSARNALIKSYFHQGYAYKDISLFLSTMHGIAIGANYIRVLIRKLGLRRRKPLSDDMLEDVVNAIRMEYRGSGKHVVQVFYELVVLYHIM